LDPMIELSPISTSPITITPAQIVTLSPITGYLCDVPLKCFSPSVTFSDIVQFDPIITPYFPHYFKTNNKYLLDYFIMIIEPRINRLKFVNLLIFQ